MAQAVSSADIQVLSDKYVGTYIERDAEELTGPSFAFNSVTFAALGMDTCLLSHSIISIACSTALLVYDPFLTLPYEIKHIWCRTFKIGTILYLFARYLPLVLLLASTYLSLSNISLEVIAKVLMRNTLTEAIECLVWLSILGRSNLGTHIFKGDVII
jgi:Family of unknown function (DUF6533)